MREIKFRVFNTITKQMFYDGFIINDRGKIFFTEAVINDEISEQLKKVYDIDYPSVFDYGDYSFQFCQPMQFTGLLDKNGKMIYEGDWCRFTTRGEIFRTQHGVVEFYGTGFKAIIEDKDDSQNLDLYYEIEIIGNIYENPELLKGEK